MSNSKREGLMKANKEKADKLDQLCYPHDPLLGESASNAAHRDQGTEFDRLLTKIQNGTGEQNDDSSNSGDPEPAPVPTGPVEPPSPPADQSTAHAHPQPAEKSEQSAKPSPSPEPSLAPDAIPIQELQKKLEEIKQQNDEVVMLQEKVHDYQETEKKWNEEWQRRRQEIAELQKKTTGHKLTDDPAQVICRLKADHDKEFVARSGQISRWWKWGCISSLIALLCTIVLWLTVSFWSDASSKTTEPPTSDLNLDFPALKELK